MAEETALPVGTDVALLRRATGIQKFGFDYDGYRWSLEYTKVSWTQQWNTIKGAFIADDDDEENPDPDLNVKEYYVLLLLKAEIRLEGGEPFSEEFLRDLDVEVFARLTSVVPSPVLGQEIEKAKKG